MSLLQLQTSYIYGPVQSRRLGRSLGINILPWDRKVCTFDCCYCQYGRTEAGSAAGTLPSVDDVLEAIENALAETGQLDAMTFSGNGEPTLHPDFPAIVRGVRRIRDRLAPSVPIALLSNSSLCMRDEIKDALSEIDLRIMKLDVGSQKMFEAVNRSEEGITFDKIVPGLAAVPDIIIQTLFIKGDVDNSTEKAVRDWVGALARIEPREVQVYSLDRPVPTKGLESLTMEELESIAQLVRDKLKLKIKAYGR